MILDAFSACAPQSLIAAPAFDLKQRRISKSQRFDLLCLRCDLRGFKSRLFGLLLFLISNDTRSGCFDPVIKKSGLPICTDSVTSNN